VLVAGRCAGIYARVRPAQLVAKSRRGDACAFAIFLLGGPVITPRDSPPKYLSPRIIPPPLSLSLLKKIIIVRPRFLLLHFVLLAKTSQGIGLTANSGNFYLLAHSHYTEQETAEKVKNLSVWFDPIMGALYSLMHARVKHKISNRGTRCSFFLTFIRSSFLFFD
jgi:hypothetical protein